MKKLAVIVLFIISLSMVLPVSVDTNFSENDTTVLFAIDICHLTDAPLTAGCELPAIYEPPLALLTPVATGLIEEFSHMVSDLLIPFPQEKPPKA